MGLPGYRWFSDLIEKPVIVRQGRARKKFLVSLMRRVISVEMYDYKILSVTFFNEDSTRDSRALINFAFNRTCKKWFGIYSMMAKLNVDSGIFASNYINPHIDWYRSLPISSITA